MAIDIKDEVVQEKKKRNSYSLKEKKVELSKEVLIARQNRLEAEKKLSTTVYFTENFRKHLKIYYEKKGFSYLHEFVEDACKQIMELDNYDYKKKIS